MYGSINRSGDVLISFNVNHEILEAPGDKKYLPCDKCGEVQPVNKNVVSFLCKLCFEEEK